jgi:hypothetical protein
MLHLVGLFVCVYIKKLTVRIYRVESFKIHENINLLSVSLGWDLNLGAPRPIGRVVFVPPSVSETKFHTHTKHY